MLGRWKRSRRKSDPCGCGGGGSEPEASRPDETPRPDGKREEVITRRTVLKGAGTAVAVSGAGGLLSAAGAVAREPAKASVIKPPFDIRDSVQYSDLDPPAIQAVYDDINRMAILIGDIPFGELFRTPLRKLVPLIESRVPVAHSYGLITDPERVESLGRAMAKRGPDVSIGEIYANARSEFSDKALKLFVGVRRQGIRLPVPGDEKHQKQRAKAIRGLIRDASTVTFLDYYSVPSFHLSGGALNAIAFANRFNLLGWGSNDRCCRINDNTRPLYYCDASAGNWCAISPDGAQEKFGVRVGNCMPSSVACA